MNDINAALRDAYERLALPQPARTGLLIELAGDMEDMRQFYLDQGVPCEEAERRVVESFDLSDHALAELAGVHCRPIRRFLDQLSWRTRGILERSAMALLAVVSASTLVKGAVSQEILRDAGPFAWPVLAVLAAATIAAAAKLYQLYVVQDHRPRSVHRYLHLPLLLAGSGLALGFLGMYGHVFLAWMLGRGDPVAGIRHLVIAVHRSAALLTIAMATSMLGATLWFASTHRASRVQEHEASLRLGLAGFPHDAFRSRSQ